MKVVVLLCSMNEPPLSHGVLDALGRALNAQVFILPSSTRIVSNVSDELTVHDATDLHEALHDMVVEL